MALKYYGFDYRAMVVLHRTQKEWREAFEKVIAENGYVGKTGKDQLAFSSKGKLLFEKTPMHRENPYSKGATAARVFVVPELPAGNSDVQRDKGNS